MDPNKDNPFPVIGYEGAELFCDRKEELKKLKSALRNGRNTVLLSPRRYGKTGLIKHLFASMAKSRREKIVYVDIYSARTVHDFNDLFINAVNSALNTNAKSFMKNAMQWFGNLRPTLSFDDMTGVPQIGLASQSTEKDMVATREIFEVLEKMNKPIHIAIDEFQQIAEFPDVRMDAVLRTYVQRSKNLHFIFSGSQKHMLLSMFTDAKRPFYASADMMELKKINSEVYTEFVCHTFKRRKRTISLEDARWAIEWCRTHTYYVQVLMNRLYGTGIKKLERNLIGKVMKDIVREQDSIMGSLRHALPPVQWQLFRAISMEQTVSVPTGKVLIHTHGLPSSAAVTHALKGLLDKELIYISGERESDGKPIYEPYDVFHGKWFKHR